MTSQNQTQTDQIEIATAEQINFEAFREWVESYDGEVVEEDQDNGFVKATFEDRNILINIDWDPSSVRIELGGLNTVFRFETVTAAPDVDDVLTIRDEANLTEFRAEAPPEPEHE